MSSDVVVALMTAPSEEVAASIAKVLVTEQLVACVNIVPKLRSIYRWKGDVCDEQEVLMIAKLAAAQFEAMRQRVVSLHPYEVPEVLLLPVSAGHAPYVDWVLGR